MADFDLVISKKMLHCNLVSWTCLTSLSGIPLGSEVSVKTKNGNLWYFKTPNYVGSLTMLVDML